MSERRWMAAVAVGAVVLGLGWALFSELGRKLASPTPDAEPSEGVVEATSVVGPRISAMLYFVAEDGVSLVGVAHDVPLGDTPAAQARALVEAQLNTDAPDPLVRAVPKDVAVRGVFLPGRDDAYVDLDSAFVKGLPGGSHNELLAAYAIVSVLTTNLSQVARVQILIDGREVETLAGHVDLREPLRKNEGLIHTP